VRKVRVRAPTAEDMSLSVCIFVATSVSFVAIYNEHKLSADYSNGVNPRAHLHRHINLPPEKKVFEFLIIATPFLCTLECETCDDAGREGHRT